MTLLLSIYVVVLACMTLGLFRWELAAWLLAPRKRQTGNHVAEVWLEWEFGRGATLFRQRYATQAAAARAVRIHAQILDWLLPTHYRDTDWNGRRIWLRHDYGIKYGVRPLASCESAAFRELFSPALPGYPAFSGEHVSAHPVFGDYPLQD